MHTLLVAELISRIDHVSNASKCNMNLLISSSFHAFFNIFSSYFPRWQDSIGWVFKTTCASPHSIYMVKAFKAIWVEICLLLSKIDPLPVLKPSQDYLDKHLETKHGQFNQRTTWRQETAGENKEWYQDRSQKKGIIVAVNWAHHYISRFRISLILSPRASMIDKIPNML